MATIAPEPIRGDHATIEAGSSAPIGPSILPRGVNFSVFSQRAMAVELLLFDDAADDSPAVVVPLGRATNRTGGYWHGFVPGIGAGQVYAYRAHGPWQIWQTVQASGLPKAAERAGSGDLISCVGCQPMIP